MPTAAPLSMVPENEQPGELAPVATQASWVVPESVTQRRLAQLPLVPFAKLQASPAILPLHAVMSAELVLPQLGGGDTSARAGIVPNHVRRPRRTARQRRMVEFLSLCLWPHHTSIGFAWRSILRRLILRQRRSSLRGRGMDAVCKEGRGFLWWDRFHGTPPR